MAVSVRCPHCQAKLSLKSEATLGKKIACPKCKNPFKAEAPPPAEEDPLAFLDEASIEDDSPPEDEEEQEPEPKEEERRSTRRSAGKKGKSPRKKSGNLLPYLFGALGLAIAVSIMIGIGLIVWQFLNTPRGLDLAWIPHDSEVVGHAKVQEIMKSPFMTAMLAGNSAPDALAQNLGVSLSEVQSVTFGGSLPAAGPGNQILPVPGVPAIGFRGAFVVRCAAPINPEPIRTRLKFSQEAQHAGKTYYRQEQSNEPKAIYFPAPGMMVMANVDVLEQLLANEGAAPRLEVLNHVDQTAHFFVAAMPKTPQATTSVIGGVPNLPVEVQQKIRVSCLEATAGQDLAIAVRSQCDDTATADALRAEYDKQISQFRQLLAFFGPMGAPFEPILASSRTETQGQSCSLTLSIPSTIKESVTTAFAAAQDQNPLGAFPTLHPQPMVDLGNLPLGNVPDPAATSLGDPSAVPMPASATGDVPAITPVNAP